MMVLKKNGMNFCIMQTVFCNGESPHWLKSSYTTIIISETNSDRVVDLVNLGCVYCDFL